MPALTRAGNEILDLRTRGLLNTQEKSSPRDLVTAADLHAEKLIIDAITAALPGHRFLSEESNNTLTRGSGWPPHLWILDPIDGTTNFMFGQPQFAISLAYAEQGVLQLGIIHAPSFNETFIGIRGQGATLNGQKLKLGPKRTIAQSLLCIGTGEFLRGFATSAELAARMQRMLEAGMDIRRLGSAALDLAWVACDRLQGFYEQGLNPWDIAAGFLIGRELGIDIADHDGKRIETVTVDSLIGRSFTIAHPAIFEDFLKVVRAP